MSYCIAQGGANLYKVNLSTGVATQLTLPTGVTLSTTRKPRFAVLNQWVVMTNSPTRNLAIDPEGVVRVLVPRPPTHPPSVAAGAGTGLTGDYSFWVSFVVKNTDDELLLESPLSPISVPVTLSNQNASLTDVATSLDDITARRVYRSLAGETTPYFILDHEGNTSEALINNTSDATVGLLPALATTENVTPPGTLPGIRFKMIVEWKSRLWAVSDDPMLIDKVFISETNKVYAWPNTVVAYPTGQDETGIVAFAPRRNQLGLLKRNGVWQIAASSGSTGISSAAISVSQIAFDTGGCIAPDSVVVVNDKVYWLGNDGVYEWGDGGIHNITDDTVRPWFQTDTYFNRTRFPQCFAKYNKLRQQVEFHLAATGSSSEDRWVTFNLVSRKWYGPHKTAAFTPSHAANLVDVNNLPIVLVGGTDGVIYVGNSTTFHDGASSIIDFDCYGAYHHMDSPDVLKTWLQMSMLSKVESGGSLTITPYLGSLKTSTAGAAITHDLTTGRELLRRIGQGELLRFRFQQATVDRGVSILGYEVPNFEDGRR